MYVHVSCNDLNISIGKYFVTQLFIQVSNSSSTSNKIIKRTTHWLVCMFYRSNGPPLLDLLFYNVLLPLLFRSVNGLDILQSYTCLAAAKHILPSMFFCLWMFLLMLCKLRQLSSCFVHTNMCVITELLSIFIFYNT